MKKLFILLTTICITFLLTSCLSVFNNSINISDEKKEIVEEVYGEISYINEYILVYKNLKYIFDNIEEVNYIIENSGSRSNAIPEIYENFYVYLDIVVHNGEYKILIYNNLMKKNADKEKMFALVDYFLPISITSIEDLLAEFTPTQEIKNFKVMFIRKETGLKHNIINNDELSNAFYNKQHENAVYMSFYDYTTGNVIVGYYSTYLWFGNVFTKEIYHPSTLVYKDLVNKDFDTLDDTRVSFSIDEGETFNFHDGLEDFDLWQEDLNTATGALFFYAFNRDEFLEKLDEARERNKNCYNYLEEDYFDYIEEFYDEDFFSEHIVMFYFKEEGNISPNYVHSVTKKNSTLTLNVNRFEGMETALSSWHEMIIINKEDIKEINEINLIVRTISPLQKSVTFYIHQDYIKDFYLNPKTMEDFKDLDNLKAIEIFTWSLNVDLIFNIEPTDEELEEVKTYLNNNPHIKSIGYSKKDFIRVQLKDHFYVKHLKETLVISDFIDDQSLIEKYLFTIKPMKTAPLASITFILEEKGKKKAEEMINDLLKGNYPFLNKDDGWYNYD